MDTSLDNLLLPDERGIQKMDPRVKKLWVEALRSRKYNQALGSLKISRGKCDAHCCLGVLCELHSRETGTLWEKQVGTVYYLGEGTVLPDAVALWAGIRSWNNDVPIIQEDENFVTATMLNDSRNKNFDQIADLIEQYL